MIYYLGVPTCVRRHSKRKKYNLFKDVDLIDECGYLDFLIEPEIGKTISRSAKTVRDGTDIHHSFQFVFDENIRSEELKSCLKLYLPMKPHLQEQLLVFVKNTSVFYQANVPIKIEDHECHIDIGDAIPKVAKIYTVWHI